MKKITVLVLFSVLVLNLNAQEKKSYGSSGKLYAIENYSNGKLHGIQKYYYESGKLKEIENYSNGKIHGVRKGYYENGQIAHITNYKDGLNHGEFKIYRENGYLTQIGFYDNDIRTGEWKSYYNSGRLESFGKFTANKRNTMLKETGLWKYYYESGRLKVTKTYSKNGELIGESKVYPDNDTDGYSSGTIEKQEVMTKNHPNYNADANSFKSVKIGNQFWMSKNLNVSNFRNGDAIPQAKSQEAWDKAGDTHSPAWCYYENDSNNGTILGKLYNWYAVNDARGLAPSGWHIPSDEEWTELTDNLGGKDKAGIKMKSMSMWNDYENKREEGVFEALPGGIRFNGKFKNGGLNGADTYWWGTIEEGTNAWGLLYYETFAVRYGWSKETGISVRCIKD